MCIEGPKYCCKTWTSRSCSESAAFIGDPANNFQTRTMASLSPDLVLQGEYPRLIDEWQKVPTLWDAVRFEVDKNNRKGKYILTCSATPEMLYNDLNTFGFIFENLCEHDLKIYAEYNGAKMYHFRDEKGNEADAVIEFPDGT